MFYLVIDPGLKHTAFVLVRVTDLAVEALFSIVADLDGEVRPDFTKAREACVGVWKRVQETLVAKSGQLERVLVEFQPPLATMKNPALVRWNSWIEGYTIAFFQEAWKGQVDHVFPAPVKQYFKICTGEYWLNKRLSKKKAQELTKTLVRTDHEADCILMAVYDFKHK